MAAVSSILAGVAIAGVGVAAYGSKKQANAQEDITRADVKAENAREKQMDLENMRKQRDIFRKMQIARSTALASTVSQGAEQGSALGGAYGQIAGQGGQEILAASENTSIGHDIFDANREKSYAQSRAAKGKAIGDFGQTLIAQANPIASVGSQLFKGFGKQSP